MVGRRVIDVGTINKRAQDHALFIASGRTDCIYKRMGECTNFRLGLSDWAHSQVPENAAT